ncbi:hypothetical protein [Streptomyces sp. NPDC059010]|uniref:hypothetical protein n=1 Tax=Streptomyces sp. NPDC059010 TaxID=3346695 RepID=UPI0036CBE1B3
MGTVGTAAALLVVGAMAGVSSADTYDKRCFVGVDLDGRDCDTGWYNPAYGSDAVSTAGFTAQGEYLWANDHEADGRGVYIKATWSGGSAEIKNTAGAGSWQQKNLDITDGKSVSLTMCQTNGGALVNCAYATAIA